MSQQSHPLDTQILTATSAEEPSSRPKNLTTLFIAISLLVILGGSACAFAYYYVYSDTKQTVTGIVQVPVRRGAFVHEVTERGNVDSAQNEEIRCEVESPSGTLIIWIIPEGTLVQQGDELCRLDSSNLLEKVTQQEITVSNSGATYQQSDADLNTAKLAREEYLPQTKDENGNDKQGVFHQLEKAIQNRILKAEEDLSRAVETTQFTERLLAQGYVTSMQLKADQAKEQQLKNDLEIAKMELDVLREYTRAKTLEQLNAAVKTAEAKVESDKRRYDIDAQRLGYYKEQLDKCTIKAPKAGQVVYASPSGPWRRDNEIIKEGNTVRERQTIIKLPDPRQMQVTGMVNEASVSLVKPGQSASISLDAMPNHVFFGTVKSVNDYPEPDSFMGSMAKEYKTIVTIDNLDALTPEQRQGVRPGLTAQVKINVSSINTSEQPLLLPVQALFEHNGQFYCITYENGNWVKIPVEIGPTNDKEVVIKSGISEGTNVVQGAWRYLEHVLSQKEQSAAREFGIGGSVKGAASDGGGNGRRGTGGPGDNGANGNEPNNNQQNGQNGNGGHNSNGAASGETLPQGDAAAGVVMPVDGGNADNATPQGNRVGGGRQGNRQRPEGGPPSSPPVNAP